MTKAILALALTLMLSGCIGDAVRGVADGAADVGTGAVDIATAPIP